MISELGVELFELCETIPNVQCSHCVLHLRTMLDCQESRRKLNKLRLDAISFPNYVIKKGPDHGARHGITEEQKECHMAWNPWKRCCKRIDSQGGHFTSIHDRFLKDQVYRELKCIEMDELAKQDHTNTKDNGISH